MLQATTFSNEIRNLVIIGIAVMLLLFTSFLVALIFNQRKKLKYQRSVERLREQQQNQLIEAAVRSEETERHRIAETLHDEVGAILSSAKLHLLGIKTHSLDDKDRQLHERGRELLNEVIDILDDAAQRIERIKDVKPSDEDDHEGDED